MATLSQKSLSVGKALNPAGSACLVCANTDVELYSDDTDRGLTPSDLGSSRNNVSHGKILRCRACGFGFRAWRPSEEELASLYRELDPAVYERESPGRMHTARRHLGIVRSCVSHGRVLDVGCASGNFLSCAADEGWQVVGVEPSSVLCAKAQDRLRGRGTVLCCSLQNAGLAEASMDVVTLWDVLEHVRDPLAFLRLCASLVVPGGYVVANVPDLKSWQARLLGKRWPLLLAEHLNYFTRKSLALAGEARQLRTVRFGRRPASFSLDYVLFRLAQHHLPGAAICHSLVRGNALGAISIPAYLGESYVVWKRLECGSRS
jgi:2-polyprenyl-3-methyl-5-hydroxy-6-metoxy-1,4-benzoquinol methylase